jgi:hypothetical protein
MGEERVFVAGEAEISDDGLAGGERGEARRGMSVNCGKPAAPIRLDFGTEVSATVQARIGYAFRVFAAVYGYRVLEDDSDEAAAVVFYGKSATSAESRGLTVPALYTVASPAAGPPHFTKRRYGGEEIPLVFGNDAKNGNPDWLGEIFQWLSSSHETGIVERDDVGRIPSLKTVFARNGISPRKPFASLLMGWMENALRNGDGEAICRAPSPLAGVQHMVVCSHDIDFYYTNRISALARLIKNLGISFRLYRSESFFRSNATMILELLGGKRVGDYVPDLLAAMGKQDFRLTLFVVTRRGHRRDPNYELTQMAARLREAEKNGCSVELHGSYTSVLGDGSLKHEAEQLRTALARKTLGGRQHWLRFDSHEKLFAGVREAELVFDSTLGFPEAAGFRNGAAFGFPPYNFREEKAHDFLEIPLVVMDGSLEGESRMEKENAQDIADEVLMESREAGWGGVSVLWHNPIEALAVPKEINRVFWNCIERREEFKERWMSAREFLGHSLGRYQDAGLLQGVRLDA